jgi:hypothetical protein
MITLFSSEETEAERLKDLPQVTQSQRQSHQAFHVGPAVVLIL